MKALKNSLINEYRICKTCGKIHKNNTQNNAYCSKQCFDNSPIFKSWINQIVDESLIAWENGLQNHYF